MAKRFKVENETVKAFIRDVRENGIRRTARQMGVEERSLRRWIQGKSIPASVIEKYRALRQG
jgi:transposase-like protein